MTPFITASFTATPLSGPSPLTVRFTDTTTGSSVTTRWTWFFGDGGFSTQQNPTYTYPRAGTYSVQLTVSNSTDVGTIFKTNYITVVAHSIQAPNGTPTNIPPNNPTNTNSNQPLVSFSGNNLSGNAPLTVTFTNTSNNIPTSWLWYFGDGNLSAIRDVTHTYTKPGVYSVSLTGINDSIASSMTQTDYVIVN